MPDNFPEHEQEGMEEVRYPRLRLESVRFERTPSGHCSATVELRTDDGSRLLGMAEGSASALGELRLTADAALRAIRAFLPSTIRLELLGVKPLRVFDANIVIVAVDISGEGHAHAKLLGSDLAEAEQIRATAKAVLNATNRLVYATLMSRV